MFSLKKSKILFFLFALAIPAYSQVNYKPPKLSAGQLKGIDFKKAKPVDESYRDEFAKCDRTPRCRRDKNNLKALLKFPDGTIFFDSKMGLDLDGSWKACSCGEKGKTDQCRTTHLWNPPHPTTTEYNRQEDKCVFYKEQAFVDAENIPYMVIPSGEKFNRLTGLKAGDFGIVIYRDKMIPVFVADTGPDFRIGEGSAALLRAVGVDRCKARNEERHCTDYEDSSIEENVLFFIFPNSKSKDLKKENALAVIKEKALKRFEEFKKSLE